MEERDPNPRKYPDELARGYVLDRRKVLAERDFGRLRSDKGHAKSHIRAASDAGATEGEVLEAIELAPPEARAVAFRRGGPRAGRGDT